ncbi:transketolase [Aequitasia blattaphilus]|uniref:Transketolase n=1 Tax=Aequitasia blattaphilus TaxID=2949332 RepID=A0ABT1ECW0_9FIRM|nr:transketolase [Aequitasia blattaphilus]MCP1103678.1 transketolase [Aequitasia blattaphilus]MCR8616318.1 transketolase [Aequitasia blattaphilus]
MYQNKNTKEFAQEIRVNALEGLKDLGFGHVGGAMSATDVLAVLYGKVMNIDPKNPQWEDRDYFVMSKGHAGPALYATLALSGYFPVEELQTINRNGTRLPSHCDRNSTPGIDMSTGALGQGMSTAIGIAHGNKILGKDNYTYLLLGDGECDEGQVWEGALYAPQHQLDHLITFIDYNKQQLDGYTKDILDLGDLQQKFNDFGWYTLEVDGHNVDAIYDAIELVKKQEGKPGMIILNTQKGKGCNFAEGILYNHHMTFSKEQCEEAIKCIKEGGK